MFDAEFLDNLVIFCYYMVLFCVFIGLVGILEKVFDRFPAVSKFFERLFDIDLSEEDDEESTEVNRYDYRY